MPVGFLAAQVVHAAGESVRGPVPPGTNAVVLAASEVELACLKLRLEASGVPHAAIVEVDEPYHDVLTAIGLPPAPKAAYRHVISSFPLYGRHKS